MSVGYDGLVSNTEYVEEIFARSPQPTLGVEWEVALVDPVTRDLVPRASEIVDVVADIAPDIHLEKEFLQNTVELVTGICNTVPEAIAELNTGIRAVQAAAKQHDIRVWGSGGHPFSDFRKNPV